MRHYKDREHDEAADEELFEGFDEDFAEYEDTGDYRSKKHKHMKKQKEESKPKWREDRKREKKFKHDVLGIE